MSILRSEFRALWLRWFRRKGIVREIGYAAISSGDPAITTIERVGT